MLDFEKIIHLPTPLVPLHEEVFSKKGIEVFIKRDDLTHEFISGNKFRKLKYNLIEARKIGVNKLLTFGGAYSNHLSAFAFACKAFGFEGKVLVRGEELNENSSPTLVFAASCGVDLLFVSREEYRDKNKLVTAYEDDFFVIPEGGSNTLALRGVGELINEMGDFDYLLTSCGTGGTMAGLIQNCPEKSQILGVSVLKGGEFLKDDITNLLQKTFSKNATLLTDYHFGGYAKYTQELLDFIRVFEKKHSILLEQVYTAKTFFAFYDLLEKDYFKPNSKVVLLHTGGLQGRLKEL